MRDGSTGTVRGRENAETLSRLPAGYGIYELKWGKTEAWDVGC